MKSLAMDIKEKQIHFERQLQTQYTVSRRKTLEIEDLKSKLKQQEGKFILIGVYVISINAILHASITPYCLLVNVEELQLKSQMSELKEKQKEIEKLKLTIEEKESKKY